MEENKEITTVNELKTKIIRHMLNTLSWDIYNTGDYADIKNKITIQNFLAISRMLDFINKEDEEKCLDTLYNIKVHGNIRKTNFMLADLLIEYSDNNLQ